MNESEVLELMRPGNYIPALPLALRYKSRAARTEFNKQLAQSMKPTPVTTRYLTAAEMADYLSAVKNRKVLPVPSPLQG